MLVCISTWYSSGIRPNNLKLEVLCFEYCSMWSTHWASNWLIYVTNGSIVVAKWHSYSPRLLPWRGCPIRREQQASWSNSHFLRLLPYHGWPYHMWATGIMKQLLFATSVVLASLPHQIWATGTMRIQGNDPPRHVCCLCMVAPIRLEQQGPTGSYSASIDKTIPKSHYFIA
jgi:hypothetical protein